MVFCILSESFSGFAWNFQKILADKKNRERKKSFPGHSSGWLGEGSGQRPLKPWTDQGKKRKGLCSSDYPLNNLFSEVAPCMEQQIVCEPTVRSIKFFARSHNRNKLGRSFNFLLSTIKKFLDLGKFRERLDIWFYMLKAFWIHNHVT